MSKFANGEEAKVTALIILLNTVLAIIALNQEMLFAAIMNLAPVLLNMRNLFWIIWDDFTTERN